jgi:hypothetical protein
MKRPRPEGTAVVDIDAILACLTVSDTSAGPTGRNESVLSNPKGEVR